MAENDEANPKDRGWQIIENEEGTIYIDRHGAGSRPDQFGTIVEVSDPDLDMLNYDETKSGCDDVEP